MNRPRAAVPVVVIAAFIGLGCARSTTASEKPGEDPPPGSSTGVSGTQQSDWSAIEKLEAEAKTLAKTAGCSSSADCRAAPVGSKACGGPRYFIPYCAKTTDSAALQRKLDEIVTAEQAYNRKYQVVSTCELRVPPMVESVGGSCVAR